MLRLIETEIIKLKRKKSAMFMLSAALIMPLISAAYFHRGTNINAERFYKAACLSYTPWIILPIVLSVFSSMITNEENQNGIRIQIRIVPVKSTEYFIAKCIIVLSYSVSFMLISYTATIGIGTVFGYIGKDSGVLFYTAKKCLEIGIIIPFAIIPVCSVSFTHTGYVFPLCFAIAYTFLGFILMTVTMYLHPLSCATAIIVRDVPGVVQARTFNIGFAVLGIALWGLVFSIYACTKRVG